MPDFRWTSMGGSLVDGNGDLAVTTSSAEEMQTMAATRLKASTKSWKLYNIGANLSSFRGQPVGINQNTALSIQRAVTAALSNQLFPAGSFSVQTVVFGNEIQVLVYVGSSVIASTSVSL